MVRCKKFFTTDHKHCDCQDVPRLLPRPRARPCSCWLPICKRQASRPVHRPKLKPGRLRRYPACLRAHAPADQSQEHAAESLALLGGDEALVATALANLLNNGMDATAICGAPTNVDAMKRRIQNYLGWEGSAGSRTLAGGVSNYLAKNFVGRTSPPAHS